MHDFRSLSFECLMSTESPPELLEKLKQTPAQTRSTPIEKPPARSSWRVRLMDGGLIALFLTLTFLLGAFPLKDTDFYWHLRTGDWIRQTGWVPRTDLFTFSRVGVPWIDLHWIFQIGISWVYEHGGIVALTLAKCCVTCVAMLVLISARRREWPVWVIILAWLPALLVLGGRMYVRPETLTLLYLSLFLAILFRWDRHPLTGPIFTRHSGRMGQLARALRARADRARSSGSSTPPCDSAFLTPSAKSGGVRFWRRPCSPAQPARQSLLHHRSALPARAGRNDEQPDFLAEHRRVEADSRLHSRSGQRGLLNLPIQLHFATMILGALSFLVPLVWLIVVHLADVRQPFTELAQLGAGNPRNRQEGKEKLPPENAALQDRQEQATEGDGSPQRLAAEPISALALRSVLCAELPGDAEQSSVRRRRRHNHGLELW